MKYNLSFTVPLSDIANIRDVQPMSFNQILFFGKGFFDDWAAYCGTPCDDGRIWCAMPKDRYYFEIVQLLASYHGVDTVYLDLLHIFERTGKKVDRKLIDRIFFMSVRYGSNQPWFFNAAMHIYYGMIAEENKENTKLGRSIKMNGLYSLLKGGRSVQESADECRNKRWQEIQAECLQRQIYRD